MMKKTRFFIFITALLITLLTVVGCDVSPVTPNSELVRASIAVSSSRDLQVVGGDGTIKKYKIAMIPEWSDPSIIGMRGSRNSEGVVEGFKDVSYSKNSGNISIDLGYVSQGKWSIYLNAYNSSGDLIFAGNTTAYLNKNSNNVVIIMQRVTNDIGYLYFNISLNRLNLTDTDENIVNNSISEANNAYRMGYKIVGSNGESVRSGYIPLKSVNESHAVFGDDTNPIQLPCGEYSVVVSLLKKDSSGIESVIGGITKLATIYPGKNESEDDVYSWILIWGEVAPSDFIQVGLDFPAPEINASISSSVENGVYTFTCNDLNEEEITEYDCYFRWFIDGELVEENKPYSKWNVGEIVTISKESSMTCSFKKLGDREVRCEVVYVPKSVATIDSNPLKFVGGASSFVQVLTIVP